MKWLLAFLKPLNDFVNDSDRGIGHGISHGLFYGLILIPLTSWSVYAVIIALVANHTRVGVQELLVEEWMKRPKTGDLWFDLIFRPLQTDVFVLGIGYLPSRWWWAVALVCLAIGFKSKNDWPLLLSWGKHA